MPLAVVGADGVRRAAGEADERRLIAEVRAQTVAQLVDVLHECVIRGVDCRVVVGIAVDGDGVSLVDHALDERLIAVGIVEDEERRFRAVLLECVENARRDALAGAIVERQVDAAGLVGLLDRDGALGGRGAFFFFWPAWSARYR